MLVVLQQNSAADLSMLVLESLEKAEVDVADELLGEDSMLRSACLHGCCDWSPAPLGGSGGRFCTSTLMMSWDGHTALARELMNTNYGPVSSWSH